MTDTRTGPVHVATTDVPANDAFPAWAGTPPVEKTRLFFKAAEIVRRRLRPQTQPQAL
jgi:acyl-CoA reductase-like NAD-dependent aldehyde dehydrogenase